MLDIDAAMNERFQKAKPVTPFTGRLDLVAMNDNNNIRFRNDKDRPAFPDGAFRKWSSDDDYAVTHGTTAKDGWTHWISPAHERIHALFNTYKDVKDEDIPYSVRDTVRAFISSYLKELEDPKYSIGAYRGQKLAEKGDAASDKLKQAKLAKMRDPNIVANAIGIDRPREVTIAEAEPFLPAGAYDTEDSEAIAGILYDEPYDVDITETPGEEVITPRLGAEVGKELAGVKPMKKSCDINAAMDEWTKAPIPGDISTEAFERALKDKLKAFYSKKAAPAPAPAAEAPKPMPKPVMAGDAGQVRTTNEDMDRAIHKWFSTSDVGSWNPEELRFANDLYDHYNKANTYWDVPNELIERYKALQAKKTASAQQTAVPTTEQLMEDNTQASKLAADNWGQKNRPY